MDRAAVVGDLPLHLGDVGLQGGRRRVGHRKVGRRGDLGLRRRASIDGTLIGADQSTGVRRRRERLTPAVLRGRRRRQSRCRGLRVGGRRRRRRLIVYLGMHGALCGADRRADVRQFGGARDDCAWASHCQQRYERRRGEEA